MRNASHFQKIPGGMAMSKRTPKRCRECGGFHTPKCKPITRKQEAEIWKVILKKYQEAENG